MIALELVQLGLFVKGKDILGEARARRAKKQNWRRRDFGDDGSISGGQAAFMQGTTVTPMINRTATPMVDTTATSVEGKATFMQAKQQLSC